MPQTSISRLASWVVQNKKNVGADFLVDSLKSSRVNYCPGSPHVQFEEPFESIMHIDIPRPPLEVKESRPPTILSPRQSRHARCKLAAAQQWNMEVLPALIQPYLAYEQMV
jgi:hypothetical protein